MRDTRLIMEWDLPLLSQDPAACLALQTMYVVQMLLHWYRETARSKDFRVCFDCGLSMAAHGPYQCYYGG